MMLSVRRLLLPVALAASLGIIAAAGLAAKEAAAQDYVRHGLWRTATWLLAHHTLVGAAAGAAAGMLTLLVLGGRLLARSLLRSRAPSEEQPPSAEAVLGLAPRLALILGACATAAVVVVPTAGPTRLGIAYSLAAGGALVLLWVIASACVSPADTSADGRPTGWLGSLWPIAISFAYIVAFLNLWARIEDARRMVILACVAFLAALLAYHTLERPVQSLVGRLCRIFGGAIHLASAARAAGAVLGCGIVLWTAGWIVGVRARARAHEAGPNVIIIAIDTLRADAVSLLSEDEHERDLTPNLRRLLASRGVVYPNATSQAPWTLPAFASIFTGIYPEEHGAQHFISTLPPDQLTLAELMREAGYVTMSVVSGHFVTSEVGMTQGFALYDESQTAGGGAITSEHITDTALAMLADHRDSRFFLFAHYFDPHHPYMNHPEFAFTTFPGPRILGAPAHPRAPGRVRGSRPADPEEEAVDRALYDEEVAYTDLHVGRLLEALEEEGLWDSTCVILVADHGEEFFEHGSAGHDATLFQELVHVPLVIADPARAAPAVVTQPVETRRLFDTILGIVGVRAPLKQGPSGGVLAAPDSEERQVRSSTRPMPDDAGEHSKRVWLTCLADGRHKFINDHLADSTMLFDLVEDPGETRDVTADHPDEAGRLRETLEALDADVSKGASDRPLPKPTEEQLRRVKDLGYL